MLDEKDLQAIKALFDEQEARLDRKIETLINAQSKDLHMGLMTVVESKIEPSLQMLAEAQQTILEKMVPPSRLDAMQLDISVLKMAVERLNEKINILEGKE